jgi:hypothetical protein
MIFLEYDNVQYPIPELVLNDSRTIKNMLGDVEYVDEDLVIRISLSGVHLLESIPDYLDIQDIQQVLPILDFLECASLIIQLIMRLLDNQVELNERTISILYGIPHLSYRALIQGLITIEDLPPYDDSIGISVEEWYEFINGNGELLI